MSTGWHIIWPWIWLLLPLPWLLGQLRPPGPALRLAEDHALATTNTRSSTSMRWPAVVLWLLILAAACRPQWVDTPITLPTEGRDLVLAIDISPSMEKKDMYYDGKLLSRLETVKAVVWEFLQRRHNDRIALVLFGKRPYWYIPLTYDLATLGQLLQEAQAGWAGERTAIGDAVLLTTSKLRNQDSRHPTLILLTDGDNNIGSKLEDAGAQAAQARLRTYTIGFGSTRNLGWLSGDAELNEAALIRLAQQTDGEFFRARDPKELEQIYNRIDELEKLPQPRPPHYPRRELFHWPLVAALVFALIMLALGHVQLRQRMTEANQ